MPYNRLAELPLPVKRALPKNAQEIYRAAYNNAWGGHRDPSRRRFGSTREEIVHRVAWAAVKRKYEVSADGRWRRKRT